VTRRALAGAGNGLWSRICADGRLIVPNMQILVVDDELPIAEILAAACAQGGHSVAIRTSSTEALDYMQSHQVDVLVTDIVMPPPDGFFLIREARKRNLRLVALAVTGHSVQDVLNEVIESGASDLISKPVRLAEFRVRIALAVERRRTLDALLDRHRQLQLANSEKVAQLERELEEARRPAQNSRPNLSLLAPTG
jgi:DNA-binding response OmpR family regulator